MADNKTISGKKVLIKDRNGNYVFPITHASLIAIDDKHTLVNIITDLQTRLARIESLIDNSNNNSSYIGIDNKKQIAYIMGVPITTGLDTNAISLPISDIVVDTVDDNSVIDILNKTGIKIK